MLSKIATVSLIVCVGFAIAAPHGGQGGMDMQSGMHMVPGDVNMVPGDVNMVPGDINMVPGDMHGRGGPGGPGGAGRHHGPPPPPFLRNTTEEARKEFFDIVKNEDQTIADQKKAVQTWAEKYSLTTEVNQFEQEMQTKMAEAQKNATELIGTLSSKLTEYTAIFSNETQTRKQQHEALQKFRQENPQVAEALEDIMMPSGREEHEHERRHGPNGERGMSDFNKQGGAATSV